MKSSFKYFLSFAGIFLMLSTTVFGQQIKYQRANRAYENHNYSKAIPLYESILERANSTEVKEKLAECYRKVGNTAKAEFWYAQVVDNNETEPVNMLRYAQMLKQNGKYEEAKRWFLYYGDAVGDIELGEDWAKTCDFASELTDSSMEYFIKPVDFNTPASEICPVPYKKGLVFASNNVSEIGGISTLGKKKKYYDMFFVDNDVQTKSPRPKIMGKDLNTKYHDGPACFNNREDVIYFSRSNFQEGDLTKNETNINKLELLSASNDGTEWSYVESMPFNDVEFSCMHPSISPDGSVLFFASDMPGGYGGVDLYYTEKQGTKWGIPQNLGADINTPGDDVFPSYHRDGFLFFASNGHPGIGGLDLFVAENKEGQWTNPVNLGAPINSIKDDFGMVWLKSKPSGYFTSSRDGGMGADDIYFFKRKVPVNIKVIDAFTHEPIENIKISTFDKFNHEQNFISDADGEAGFYCNLYDEFKVDAVGKDYEKYEGSISTVGISPAGTSEVIIEMVNANTFLGIVEDFDQGTPVEGCEVTLLSADMDKKVMTNDIGTYSYYFPDPKNYTILITKEGYIPEVITVNKSEFVNGRPPLQRTRLKKGNGFIVDGKVLNKSNGLPIPDATSTAVKENQFNVLNRKTDETGRFWMVLEKGPEYSIAAEKDQFGKNSVNVGSVEYKGVQLVPVIIELMEGGTKADLVKIIYFNYDRSRITELAELTLMEIIEYMKVNPSSIVDLSGHTDSRGDAGYNQKLSYKRAQATVDYLFNKGIALDRTTAKGEGETRLSNPCADGVPCSEKDHKLNRRVELLIRNLLNN